MLRLLQVPMLNATPGRLPTNRFVVLALGGPPLRPATVGAAVPALAWSVGIRFPCRKAVSGLVELDPTSTDMAGFGAAALACRRALAAVLPSPRAQHCH